MMVTHFNELRGRMADQGRRVSLEDISKATGIRKATLIAISKNRLHVWRPEYIDALCVFFDVQIGELLNPEPVDLPLQLNLRPDRRGVQVGKRTKRQEK